MAVFLRSHVAKSAVGADTSLYCCWYGFCAYGKGLVLLPTGLTLSLHPKLGFGLDGVRMVLPILECVRLYK